MTHPPSSFEPPVAAVPTGHEAQSGCRPAGGACGSWLAWFFPPLLAILVCDQASKHWLFSRTRQMHLPAWIDLSYNPGVAWGRFDQWPTCVLFVSLALIPALAVIHWRWFRPIGRGENLAFGLILGGALGNLWDRILTALGADGYQGVRDFIRVDLKPIGIDYIWPTFNVADAGISVGFALLVMLAALRPATQKT